MLCMSAELTVAMCKTKFLKKISNSIAMYCARHLLLKPQKNCRSYKSCHINYVIVVNIFIVVTSGVNETRHDKTENEAEIKWFDIKTEARVYTVDCLLTIPRYASAPCKLTISWYFFAMWHLFQHIGYLRYQQQVDL